MSKPAIAALIVGAVTAIGLPSATKPAAAADLQVPAVHERAAYCGPCGCLHVTFDYHREVRSTYGLNYDPRNFDTTEPYFYLGPMRAYPQYSCDDSGDFEQWR